MNNQELENIKQKLSIEVENLIALKKKLYSDIDISEPMCKEEKELNNKISIIWSQIFNIIKEKKLNNK